MERKETRNIRRSLSCLSMLTAVLVLSACGEKPALTKVAGGEPQQGKELIERYGCAACHAIPGVDHLGSNVGPPLEKFGHRAYVGGVLPNYPENLVRWLMNPPAIDPRTAMPNLGVSESEARHIAAYLYTLKTK